MNKRMELQKLVHEYRFQLFDLLKKIKIIKKSYCKHTPEELEEIKKQLIEVLVGTQKGKKELTSFLILFKEKFFLEKFNKKLAQLIELPEIDKIGLDKAKKSI